MAEGRVEEVGNVLPLVIHPTLDYTSAQSLSRLARRLNACLERGTRSPKIAILGSFTTGPLLPFMELFLFAARMKAEFYEADYGVFRQDVLDPTSSLHQFRPDILVLATCWRDLGPRPGLGSRPAEVQSRIDDEVAGWVRLWRAAHDLTGCQNPPEQL